MAEQWQTFANYLSVLLKREVTQGDTGPGEDARELRIPVEGFKHPIAVHLPPYTSDELAAADKEWQALSPDSALQSGPRWILAHDRKFSPWLLSVGIECNAADGHILQVRFPTSWPANSNGRGDISSAHSADWREIRSLGEAARPHDWNLRVQSLVLPDFTVGLWGLIDLAGDFVLPCVYEHLSEPEGLLWSLSCKTAAPLPANRHQSWMWSEVRRFDEPTSDASGREVCDVIEVWSGRRINPPGIKAWKKTLKYGYFIACHDTTDESVKNSPQETGVMLVTQPTPGPMRWSNWGDCPGPLTPARCARTGLWGYVGPLGENVIEPQFSKASTVDSGLAIVRLSLTEAQHQNIALRVDREWLAPTGVVKIEAKTDVSSTSAWNWVLLPRWLEVAGEFDGHFTVKNTAGWGMVTPDGMPVTPFYPREPRGFTEDNPHDICRAQLKRLQARRFVDWLLEAANNPTNPGSLAAMKGRLFSSFGAYDHGALPFSNIAVRITKEVIVSERHGDVAVNSRPCRKSEMLASTRFSPEIYPKKSLRN